MCQKKLETSSIVTSFNWPWPKLCKNFENGVQSWSSMSARWLLQLPYRNSRQLNDIDRVEKWPLKTVEINTALCPQIPSPKLPVWTAWTHLNLRFQTNHSKTSIILVPWIFIVLFMLICRESQAFLQITRKSLLSVFELDCVITGLGQSSPLLNFLQFHIHPCLFERWKLFYSIPIARFVNASTGS